MAALSRALSSISSSLKPPMNTSSGRSWIVHLMELLMELKGGVEEICDGVVSAMPVGQVHSLLVLLGVHVATFFPRH